jgi:hypothetical protein
MGRRRGVSRNLSFRNENSKTAHGRRRVDAGHMISMRYCHAKEAKLTTIGYARVSATGDRYNAASNTGAPRPGGRGADSQTRR